MAHSVRVTIEADLLFAGYIHAEQTKVGRLVPVDRQLDWQSPVPPPLLATAQFADVLTVLERIENRDARVRHRIDGPRVDIDFDSQPWLVIDCKPFFMNVRAFDDPEPDGRVTQNLQDGEPIARELVERVLARLGVDASGSLDELVERIPEVLGEPVGDPVAGSVDRVVGSLLGGAIGDALGAPIEFQSAETIAARFGDRVSEFMRDGSAPLGAITDDTQMTLFTADALVRAGVSDADPERLRTPIAEGYLDWYDTQSGGRSGRSTRPGASPLLEFGWLYAQRAPGVATMAALSALAAAGIPHSSAVPAADNDSKGCGTTMRSAPFGLVANWAPRQAFELARDAATITHAHPTGGAAAAAFAALIRYVLAGGGLWQSSIAAQRIVAFDLPHEAGSETWMALHTAHETVYRDPGTLAGVARVGQGWIAEEALAIAVYCALSFPERHQVGDALSLAVAHSGDSDSTGAICGNILGALHGVDALPTGLLERVEGREVIERVARALT